MIEQEYTRFWDQNEKVFYQAESENDTVTQNRIVKELTDLTGEKMKKYRAFVDENINSAVAMEAFVTLLQDSEATSAGLKATFEKFPSEVRETKLGKNISEYISKLEENEKAQAATAQGKTAPDFSAQTPEGTMLSLKKAMGKATIIDFWASWCGPCRHENPNVVALYNELHGKGLNIIGVSLDKDAAKWKAAIAEDKLIWQHVSTLKGWDDTVAKRYGVNSIPETVLLDANGVIIARGLKGEGLRLKVMELLGVK